MEQTILRTDPTQTETVERLSCNVGGVDFWFPAGHIPTESVDGVREILRLKGLEADCYLPFIASLDSLAAREFEELKNTAPPPEDMYPEDIAFVFIGAVYHLRNAIRSIYPNLGDVVSDLDEKSALLATELLTDRLHLYARFALMAAKLKDPEEQLDNLPLFISVYAFFWHLRIAAHYALNMDKRLPSLRGVTPALVGFYSGKLPLRQLLAFLDPKPTENRPKQYPFPGEDVEDFRVRRLGYYVERWKDAAGLAARSFPGMKDQAILTAFLAERIPFKVFDDHKADLERKELGRAKREDAWIQRGEKPLSYNDEILTVEVASPPTPETTRRRYKDTDRTATCVWCRRTVDISQMHPKRQECLRCHELREYQEAESNPKKAETRAHCMFCGGSIRQRVCQSCNLRMPDGAPITAGAMRWWTPTYPERFRKRGLPPGQKEWESKDPRRSDSTGQLPPLHWFKRGGEPRFCRKDERAVTFAEGRCPVCGSDGRSNPKREITRLRIQVIGRAVKTLRESRGMSIERLAQESGLRLLTLHKLEEYDGPTLRRMPPRSNIEQLARSLGVGVEDLIPSRAIQGLLPDDLHKHFESRGNEKYQAGPWQDDDPEPSDGAHETHASRYRAPRTSTKIASMAERSEGPQQGSEEEAKHRKIMEVLEYARQQWGEKAHRYFSGVLMEGMKQRQAARVAGIGEDMGNSYTARLKARMSEEKRIHSEVKAVFSDARRLRRRR